MLQMGKARHKVHLKIVSIFFTCSSAVSDDDGGFLSPIFIQLAGYFLDEKTEKEKGK